MSYPTTAPVPGARHASAFRHASDLPPQVFRALEDNEATANVILPFARKAEGLPRERHSNVWVVQYDAEKQVELVLSCTTGPLGDYPVFIVPSASFAQRIRAGAIQSSDGAQTDGEHEHAQEQKRALVDAIAPLAHCLLQDAAVPPTRIFSVFAPAVLAEAFAVVFVAQAHAQGTDAIQALPKPYYDAIFTFCTSETLREAPEPFQLREGDSEHVTIELRRACGSDLEQVQALFRAFSKTSPPYILDDARATLEAQSVLTAPDGVPLWVHMARKSPDKDLEMACLVATTRQSPNVTAITKVFTHPDWRGCGIFKLQPKQRVVLYVGTGLSSAQGMYDRVGFQGVDPNKKQHVEGVERWLEIGFEGTNLGYW